ncbi:unnamed protein product [Ambrosiozyma monospora]|uniref:Unnamed protein product n=1 Tax=Ambrosiozyma monospora TaxID=43982 RepID=A0ACB5U2A3_AMBMO|nr:unnamed protein product [Ambrosiozyma monospora]
MEVNHSGWWKAYPGAYCWLYVLQSNMFWEAHPFTVVSAATEQNFNQLVFIIRIKNGLTKKLADFICEQPTAECKIPILVEGAYGNNIPFKGHDTSVFVAGGVGMTVIYSMAVDLAKIYRAQQLRGQRESEGDRKSISIVWMVPNLESVLAFRKEIATLKDYFEILELQIFVTQKLEDPELDAILTEYQKKVEPFSPPPTPSLPNISPIIDRQISIDYLNCASNAEFSDSNSSSGSNSADSKSYDSSETNSIVHSPANESTAEADNTDEGDNDNEKKEEANDDDEEEDNDDNPPVLDTAAATAAYSSTTGKLLAPKPVLNTPLLETPFINTPSVDREELENAIAGNPVLEDIDISLGLDTLDTETAPEASTIKRGLSIRKSMKSMVNSTAAHLSSSLKYLHTSESKHPTQQSSASTSTIDQPLHSSNLCEL